MPVQSDQLMMYCKSSLTNLFMYLTPNKKLYKFQLIIYVVLLSITQRSCLSSSISLVSSSSFRITKTNVTECACKFYQIKVTTSYTCREELRINLRSLALQCSVHLESKNWNCKRSCIFNLISKIVEVEQFKDDVCDTDNKYLLMQNIHYSSVFAS